MPSAAPADRMPWPSIKSPVSGEMNQMPRALQLPTHHCKLVDAESGDEASGALSENARKVSDLSKNREVGTSKGLSLSLHRNTEQSSKTCLIQLCPVSIKQSEVYDSQMNMKPGNKQLEDVRKLVFLLALATLPSPAQRQSRSGQPTFQ